MSTELYSPVEYPHVDLAQEVRFRNHEVSSSELEGTPGGDPWTIDDGQSYVAVDKQGRPLMLVLRGFASPKNQVLPPTVKMALLCDPDFYI